MGLSPQAVFDARPLRVVERCRESSQYRRCSCAQHAMMADAQHRRVSSIMGPHFVPGHNRAHVTMASGVH